MDASTALIVLAALAGVGIVIRYAAQALARGGRLALARRGPAHRATSGADTDDADRAARRTALREGARRDPDAWLPGAIRFFQELDFYASYRDTPTAEVGPTIAALMRWHRDEILAPTGPDDDSQLADMVLLSADWSRVWWRDLEGVFSGEGAYVTTLQEWAAISRGAFAPAGLVERWHGEDGPADIDFTLGDARQRLAHPGLRDDFLNMNIVREINRLLPATGPRFRVCDRGGMPNFVVALTEGEKARLERERGWTFCDFLE